MRCNVHPVRESVGRAGLTTAAATIQRGTSDALDTVRDVVAKATSVLRDGNGDLLSTARAVFKDAEHFTESGAANNARGFTELVGLAGHSIDQLLSSTLQAQAVQQGLVQNFDQLAQSGSAQLKREALTMAGLAVAGVVAVKLFGK